MTNRNELERLLAAATERPFPITDDPETNSRFWEKVDVRGPEDCWEWIGSKLVQGYGNFWLNKTVTRSHRITLSVVSGPPPSPKAMAMHKCDNTSCVNPAHLVWGTAKDNHSDMWRKGRAGGPVAQNAAKTHCLRGHPLSGDNLRLRGRDRICRQCHRDYAREAMRKSRARQALGETHDR